MSQITRYGDGGTPLADVETLTGDVGGPVGPDGAFNINILGGNNILTTGNPGTNTITIDLNGTTNHALQVGNATGSLTSLAVATNGQIPIGSTGADPVIANITAGTGISITNGAGTITIEQSPDSDTIATVVTVGAVTGNLFTLTLAANNAATINALITGTVSDYSAALVGRVTGGARRAGVGAILVGSPIAEFSEDSAGSPIIDIIVSGNDVIVQVTGVAAQTWNWRGQINYVLQTV